MLKNERHCLQNHDQDFSSLGHPMMRSSWIPEMHQKVHNHLAEVDDFVEIPQT